MGKGWLGAPLIKNKKFEEGNARKPCGMGSRSPMKCTSGVQSGSRGEAPESSCVFQLKNNILKANSYSHKIVNIGLGRFSTWGGGAQTTASEASRPSACARRSGGGGSRRPAPWRWLQGGSAPLRKNILYFAS